MLIVLYVIVEIRHDIHVEVVCVDPVLLHKKTHLKHFIQMIMANLFLNIYYKEIRKIIKIYTRTKDLSSDSQNIFVPSDIDG